MTAQQLQSLLNQVDGAPELILAPGATGGKPARWFLDPRQAVWHRARSVANAAYAAWCATRDADDYAVYRAAEDRADAAQIELERALSPR